MMTQRTIQALLGTPVLASLSKRCGIATGTAKGFSFLVPLERHAEPAPHLAYSRNASLIRRGNKARSRVDATPTGQHTPESDVARKICLAVERYMERSGGLPIQEEAA
jgi:hypothetical protein